MRHQNTEKTRTTARHVHNHLVSLWTSEMFAPLSAERLRNPHLFVRIGGNGNVARSSHEADAAIRAFLRCAGREDLSVMGIRVIANRAQGYDGYETKTLLRAGSSSEKFILTTFESTKRGTDFFQWELLPYAGFSGRRPMNEGIHDNKTTGPSFDFITVPTPKGIVKYAPIISTLEFTDRESRIVCKYFHIDPVFFGFFAGDLRDDQLRLIRFREDVPESFVNAVQYAGRSHLKLRSIVESFNSDLESLPYRRADSARIIQTPFGTIEINSANAVTFTAGHTKCSYNRDNGEIIVNGRRAQSKEDIPPTFLVVMTTMRDHDILSVMGYKFLEDYEKLPKRKEDNATSGGMPMQIETTKGTFTFDAHAARLVYQSHNPDIVCEFALDSKQLFKKDLNLTVRPMTRITVHFQIPLELVQALNEIKGQIPANIRNDIESCLIACVLPHYRVAAQRNVMEWLLRHTK